MNHKKCELQASFKNEARFFFEIKRSDSFCDSQSGALKEVRAKRRKSYRGHIKQETTLMECGFIFYGKA